MINKIQYNFFQDKTCKKIISLLNKKEDTTRFVGGCVRDSLIGIDTKDIDIATKLEPNDVINILTSASINAIPTGIDHGTVTVFSKNFIFEITTLRSDIETDGRHAEVIFSDSWEKDASRRDFTINSIYLKQNGDIYDPYNGVQHLKERKITFIGEPNERINEDYLRILRFFRFNAFYGNDNLKLSNNSVEACATNKNKIKKLSSERVHNEFFKILSSTNPYFVIDIMKKIGILDILFEKKVETKFFKKLISIEEKNSLIMDQFLRFVSLAPNAGKTNLPDLKMFNFSKKDRKNLLLLTSQEFKINNKSQKNDIERILYLIDKKSLIGLAILSWVFSSSKAIDKKWKSILTQINKTKTPIFPLKAKDLLSFGLEEGPIIGEILKEIEQDWINSCFELSKEELLLKSKAFIIRKSHNIY
ncbi:MAG: poly(A) polymerase [Rhodobiaceae bacterium]|nr:poly(A) polymerase [Rhodobiaceae bacterium]|tara:strand:- start:1022 stop:2275 length:1254 start_codon:yes stop_codon:yes gene_type:complete